MPFINLIQEQQFTVRQNERKSRGLFFTFAGVLCSSVLAAGYLFIEAGQLADKEQQLKQKLEKLQPQIQQTEVNSRQIAVIAPKLTTLESAQKTTQKWTRILDHLSRNMPDSVWLTNLRCVASDPTKPIQLTLNGLSVTQEGVGDLILRTQRSAELENVQLKFTQEKIVETSKGIEFEIAADLVGTAAKKVVDEQKEKA